MTCQRDRRWNKGGAGKASVMIGAGERQERSNIRSLEEDGSRVPFNQLRGGNDAIEKGTEKLQEFRNSVLNRRRHGVKRPLQGEHHFH
jgi:hypothetical protein